jgi:hypothetical protein
MGKTPFLVVLFVTLLVTIAAGGVALVGAFWWPDPMTSAQEQTFAVAAKIFETGAIYLFGLLAGRLG